MSALGSAVTQPPPDTYNHWDWCQDCFETVPKHSGWHLRRDQSVRCVECGRGQSWSHHGACPACMSAGAK